MDTKEILARFIAISDDVRFYMRAPFTRGDGFVYSTNGHIAVRVREADELTAEISDKPKNIGDLFAKNKRDSFLDTFPYLPDPEKCDECDGTGIGYECLDCDSTGQSGDKGNEVACWKCEGSGHAQQPVKVGGFHYNRRYLAKIADLPGVRVSPGATEQEPLYFTFDGGEGLIMSMRV